MKYEGDAQLTDKGKTVLGALFYQLNWREKWVNYVWVEWQTLDIITFWIEIKLYSKISKHDIGNKDLRDFSGSLFQWLMKIEI